MNENWQHQLQQYGAVFAAGEVLHFGHPKDELRLGLTSDTLNDLSHWGLLTVSGADAETFLQGQLTADVVNLPSRSGRLGGYCTPKGRLLATFRLWRRGTDIHLWLPRSQLATIQQRLQMFILRAQVTLEDHSDHWLSLGLSGPNSGKTVRSLLSSVPEQPGELIIDGDKLALRLPGTLPRFLLQLNASQEPVLLERLLTSATLVGSDCWRLQDVMSGFPVIYPQTREQFIPQMVNLQLLDGVNFKKGCYTGQEVIARTEHLGRLKRRMHLGFTPQPTAPATAIYCHDDIVGQVVDSAPHPSRGHAALVVIAESHLNQPLQLGSATSLALTLDQLPYSLPQLA